MFIAVEGVDGAGKSTFVAALRNAVLEKTVSAIPPRTVHLGPPRWDAMLECFGSDYFNYAPLSGSNLIADRYHLGCPVYGPIYRPDKDLGEGYGDMTTGQFRLVELFLLSRGGIVCLLDVEADVARERLLERGDEDYIDLDDLSALVDRYREVRVKSYALASHVHSLELDRVKTVAESLVDLAWSRENSVSHLRGLPRYFGAPRPDKVYLVDALFIDGPKLLQEMRETEWPTIGITDNPDTLQKVQRILEM